MDQLTNTLPCSKPHTTSTSLTMTTTAGLKEGKNLFGRTIKHNSTGFNKIYWLVINYEMSFSGWDTEIE